MNESRPSKLVLVIAFSVVMFLIVQMYPVLTAPFKDTELYGLVGTSLFFINFFLMYMTLVVFLKWEGVENIGDLGLKIEEPKAFPHLMIGAIAGTVGAVIVVIFAIIYGGDLRPAAEITGDLVTSQIIITVPVALFEELCYRGYLMPRMSELWGRGAGILVSSLFFALLHFSWWFTTDAQSQVVLAVPPLLIILFTFNLMLGGIILSLSYYWSGERLWVPIGFHFMWNMLAYIVFPVYPRDSVVSPEIFQIEWGITTILGFIFGLSLIWMLLSFLRDKK
ncbi:MAG: lysostaphin resistance A-like protein [Candidatus Thorarchaeota archaeon]